MSFLLPNLSSPPLHKPSTSLVPSSLAAKLAAPPLHLAAVQPASAPPKTPPILPPKPPNNANNKDQFYLNLGVAVRTLRQDLPLLFAKDLDYSIYRDDITFIDPLNTFQGIENYKLIFWALRFHGKILFREIKVQIFRIWQPSENMILIRWELQGVPRVPWKAKGRFSGSSWYKLDRHGKIYEHKVDNLALNFPRAAMASRTVMDLVAAATCPPSPNLTFRGSLLEDEGTWMDSCPWLELYRAVKGTLEHEGQGDISIGIKDLATCL